jgi:hypothetical protein
MLAPKQFQGKADEFRDSGNGADGRSSAPSTRYAIDAWESEGGGSAEAVSGFAAARTALADIAGWRADNNARRLENQPDEETSDNTDARALTLAGDDDRILRCLGAAVIKRWNTIPTKLQRELFANASSVGEQLRAGALKGEIARFLHKHKDGAG